MNKSTLFFIPLYLFFLITSSYGSVLPHNNLRISPDIKGQITETEFHQIIDQFEKTYHPIIKKKGGKLTIQRMWSASEVNAYAGRFYPLFSITIMGGLARHPLMSKDALTLALCHEMGHLLGYAPTKKQIPNRWASVEGQADYFATLKCSRRIWDVEAYPFTSNDQDIDPVIDQNCRQSFKNPKQIAICNRSIEASLKLTNMMASILNDGPISLDTPNESIVNETLSDHANSQCRLDTFFQGALCEIDYKVDLSKNNPETGACYQRATLTTGARPLCWFYPN